MKKQESMKKLKPLILEAAGLPENGKNKLTEAEDTLRQQRIEAQEASEAVTLKGKIL